MLSVDSKLWRVRAYNDWHIHITQRSSGVSRQFGRCVLPSDEALAAMSENRFNALCRGIFHGDIITWRNAS